MARSGNSRNSSVRLNPTELLAFRTFSTAKNAMKTGGRSKRVKIKAPERAKNPRDNVSVKSELTDQSLLVINRGSIFSDEDNPSDSDSDLGQTALFCNLKTVVMSKDPKPTNTDPSKSFWKTEIDDILDWLGEYAYVQKHYLSKCRSCLTKAI